MTARAYTTCRVVIRLDGADPVTPPPESESDYREEYRAFWDRFAGWLGSEGIDAPLFPPPGWWFVEAVVRFGMADLPRAVAWLKTQGVTFEE